MTERVRLPHDEINRFATQLLCAAGLEADKSATVARVLVEGDLLGHDTHGVALLAPYLADLESGGMASSGSPHVINDKPAALTWDGMRLPGPWLVVQAIEAAIPRARALGTCSVAIRRSHHIACLAAYLKPVTDAGLMIVIHSSGPDTTGVAPHGGCTPTYTPNPIAAGWPTQGDPVLVDISSSISTITMSTRMYRAGSRLPGQWLIDAQGRPTDDPAVMFAEPKGALLPLGGVDAGHKGYALGLTVEALTGGLAGHGRADGVKDWSANVLVQVMDPECFGGLTDFERQTQFLVDACRASTPRPGVERVRIPGERALARRAEQLASGIALHPSILPALAPWAGKLDVPLPG